jgi:hypothetical protein
MAEPQAFLTGLVADKEPSGPPINHIPPLHIARKDDYDRIRALRHFVSICSKWGTDKERLRTSHVRALAEDPQLSFFLSNVAEAGTWGKLANQCRDSWRAANTYEEIKDFVATWRRAPTKDGIEVAWRMSQHMPPHDEVKEAANEGPGMGAVLDHMMQRQDALQAQNNQTMMMMIQMMKQQQQAMLTLAAAAANGGQGAQVPVMPEIPMPAAPVAPAASQTFNFGEAAAPRNTGGTLGGAGK